MGVIKDQSVKVMWAYRNKTYYINMGIPFTKIGDIFDIHVNKLPDNAHIEVQIECDFCGNVASRKLDSLRDKENCFCSPSCAGKAKRNRVKFNCDFCGKEGEKTSFQYNKHKNHFCGSKCSEQFDRTDKEKRVLCTCEQCDTEYSVTTAQYNRYGSRFCSVKCRNKWESENKIGENHHSFSSTLIKCHYCNTDHFVPQHKLNKQEHFFCSKECRQAWYSEVWSQSPEWREESQVRAAKMISDGVFDHTDTSCQKILNRLLNEMGVDFTNEYNCKYYAIDNYLNEYNLMIEVMGSYWHCDPRVYTSIDYQRQLDRIRNDKRKRTYISDNYGINILYLWENDLLNNKEMCGALIKEYISHRGLLINYHSFNYEINDKDQLVIKTALLKSYFEYDKNQLYEITNIDEEEKRSFKQPDKWIVFNCERCGKEKEQLLSRYNKCKTHCCSLKCSNSLRALIRNN